MRALTLIRAGYGAVELQQPGFVSELVGQRPLDHRAATVVQALGGRDLVQAAVCAVHPTAATFRLGVGVDLLHAASMVALAMVDPKYRRVATTQALTATAFAVAGMVTSRRARSTPRGSRSTFAELMNPS